MSNYPIPCWLLCEVETTQNVEMYQPSAHLLTANRCIAAQYRQHNHRHNHRVLIEIGLEIRRCLEKLQLPFICLVGSSGGVNCA